MPVRFCLVSSEEGRQASKEICSDFPERWTPTMSRKNKLYLVFPWSPYLLLLPWIPLGYIRSLLFTDLNPKYHSVLMQKCYKCIKT